MVDFSAETKELRLLRLRTEELVRLIHERTKEGDHLPSVMNSILDDIEKEVDMLIKIDEVLHKLDRR